LPNDLVVNVWGSLSGIYFAEVIMLSKGMSGLVLLIGYVSDGFMMPLISYCSDNVETRFGKRMPWYFIGNGLCLPFFYLLFNPPDSAIGSETKPDPWPPYFLIVAGLMMIGMVSTQVSHMSLVNSISYD
jgi:Na+/melibiose symporter-like transporter